jgi:hypothetical protein
MSENLPPGVFTSDIDRHYRGGGIPDHDHEWMPVEGLSPVLEDMAAIFHEQCHWAEVTSAVTSKKHDETFYGYGAECTDERHYRHELAYVELPCGQRLDRDDINRLEQNDDPLFETVLDVVIGAERAFPEDTEVVDIDPDPDVGQVVIRYDGYELGYGGEA